MQILHTGRYAYHPLAVAPTKLKAPISPFTPWQLGEWGIQRQIRCFVRCAKLAQQAGVTHLADGVGMLAEQAAEAFLWWRGVRPDTQGVIAQLTVPLV